MPSLSLTSDAGGSVRSIAIVFCFVFVLFSFDYTQATIIHIPADSSTIQGGINGAVDGDTVLVSPGHTPDEPFYL